MYKLTAAFLSHALIASASDNKTVDLNPAATQMARTAQEVLIGMTNPLSPTIAACRYALQQLRRSEADHSQDNSGSMLAAASVRASRIMHSLGPIPNSYARVPNCEELLRRGDRTRSPDGLENSTFPIQSHRAHTKV